jgi:hypothetical protein
MVIFPLVVVGLLPDQLPYTGYPEMLYGVTVSVFFGV